MTGIAQTTLNHFVNTLYDHVIGPKPYHPLHRGEYTLAQYLLLWFRTLGKSRISPNTALLSHRQIIILLVAALEHLRIGTDSKTTKYRQAYLAQSGLLEFPNVTEAGTNELARLSLITMVMDNILKTVTGTQDLSWELTAYCLGQNNVLAQAVQQFLAALHPEHHKMLQLQHTVRHLPGVIVENYPRHDYCFLGFFHSNHRSGVMFQLERIDGIELVTLHLLTVPFVQALNLIHTATMQYARQ